VRHALATTWADDLIVSVNLNADIDERRAAAERLAEENG
jgi:hypothetical protein